MVAAGKERTLLSQMRMMSPRIGSPRLPPLLRPDAEAEMSPEGSPLPRIVPYGQQRGLRETGESRFFDGRVTTPRRLVRVAAVCRVYVRGDCAWSEGAL